MQVHEIKRSYAGFYFFSQPKKKKKKSKEAELIERCILLSSCQEGFGGNEDFRIITLKRGGLERPIHCAGGLKDALFPTGQVEDPSSECSILRRR